MSHSKRNTSRAVFTSHERALAKANWATSSARLGRESYLPFGSCGLCLEISREPVACTKGDIFCRECALTNLLAQRKELKRADKLRREAEEEAAKNRAADDEEEQRRAIRDFELTQVGLEAAGRKQPSSSDAKPNVHTDETTQHNGLKRKFALDEDEVSRIAKEDRAKARKAIDDEKAAKQTLPSFWTPSLTPDVNDSKVGPAAKRNKTTPICPASSNDSPHTISMQKLVTIQFNEETDDKSKNARRICPACMKILSNASNPVMAQQCGHVLCLSCVKKFLLPTEKQPSTEKETPIACYVCETPVAGRSREGDSAGKLPAGLVNLRSEGTGFSSKGANTVEKSGVNFQC